MVTKYRRNSNTLYLTLLVLTSFCVRKGSIQRLRFQANMQIDCFSFIKILPKVLLLKQGDEKSKDKP